jgi:hypothetical protein
MAAIMDALAGAVPTGIVTRAYGHPVGSVVPPAAVVGYPTEFEYDSVFLRGSDRLVIPVWYVCGSADDASARDTVSAVVGGTGEIKAALETAPALLAEIQTARVTDATFESVMIGAVPMIAVRFDVEVYT